MLKALLFVDDAATRDLLEQGCRVRGQECHVAASATQAKRACNDGEYDLLIFDGKLQPAVDCDLFHHFKTCRRGAGAYAFLLGSLDDLEKLPPTATADVDDYLIQPLDARRLTLQLGIAERNLRLLVERRRIEESLHDTTEQLVLAAEGTQDGFWYAKVFLDPWFLPEQPVWYSSRMKVLMGYADDCPGTLAMWSERVHPDDRPRVFQALDDHFLQRIPYDVEYRLVVDGDSRWFNARGQAQWDADGRPTRIAGSIRDITDRKQAETALRKERSLLQQLVEVHERERQLFAYEIHDGVMQDIAASLMHIETFDELQGPGGVAAREELDRGLKLLRSAVSETRRLISGLRPPILDEAGIVVAIEYLIHEHIDELPQVSFRNDTRFDRLAPPLENAVFRVVQEALNNVRLHSHCPGAHVELVQTDDRLRLEVRDWGIGFDPRQVHEDRFGLQGIRERARLLGGHAVIESGPGQGARISVEFPLLLADAPAATQGISD